jgi:hypothetical protein
MDDAHSGTQGALKPITQERLKAGEHRGQAGLGKG